MKETGTLGRAVRGTDAPPFIEPTVPSESADSGNERSESSNHFPAKITQEPWTNSRFWVLQLVILALWLTRLAATVAFHWGTSSLAIEFSTLGLFLVPVVFAALNYGFAGSVFTAAWVTLLAVPRLVAAVGDGNHIGAWTEVGQVFLLDAMAFLIGQRVTAERNARRLAESAHQAHMNAEALYRDLFDSNQAPILIVDGSGRVVEANSSAQRAFAATIGQRAGDSELISPALIPARLVDMIGADAAGQVLSRLISGQLPRVEGDTEDDSEVDRVQPVAFEIEGQPVLFRPTATMLGPSETGARMQVVFEDVTAETRRHDLMEAYAARVVLGQEEERRHIAQELHDGPVQTLIHLCRQIDEVGSQGYGDDGGVLKLSDLRVIVEDIVAELRSIASGLRPSVLDDLGLVASINQIVSEAGARQQFETSFGVTGQEKRMAPTVELALFRIAQEALSNVERHAAASRIAVGLNFEEHGLRLLVKDDGIGFDVKARPEASNDGTQGLSGMSERAHLIGSRLTIHSGVGSGTTIDVWVPATIIDGR